MPASLHVATALDDFPRPPCAELLGWHVLDARPKEGWIRIGFMAKPEFTNPAGFIQGGFLAAMLDDTMGPAAFVMSEGALYTASIDFYVSFLAPARPGPLIGDGARGPARQEHRLPRGDPERRGRYADRPGDLQRAAGSVGEGAWVMTLASSAARGGKD